MAQNFVNGLVFGGEVQFPAANQSAFGVLETVNPTPVFQGDFTYGLNSQVWSAAVVSGTGATVDTNASRLRIQSGTGSAGYAYITSRRSIRYRAGQGTTALFTPLFSAGIANNVQLWGVGTIAAAAPYDGYFFGYNGISFGIAHYTRGSGVWTAQTNWNGDKCLAGDGTFTLDPTKGVPMMIKYPYLGYGDIEFFAQVPETGRWTLLHIIKYANTVATTQLSNPTLNFLGWTLNSGNTTNKTMYCGSVGVFISGIRSFVGNPKWAMDNYKTNISAETCLLNLRNAATYNGVTNRGLIRLNSISASNTIVNMAVLRLKIGATIGGSPSYTPINGSTADGGVTITSGNSIASVDTAGTTVTGGTYIYNLQIDPQGGQIIDLTPLEIFVAPGETLTISGFAANPATIGVSVNWSEDI